MAEQSLRCAYINFPERTMHIISIWIIFCCYHRTRMVLSDYVHGLITIAKPEAVNATDSNTATEYGTRSVSIFILSMRLCAQDFAPHGQKKKHTHYCVVCPSM